MLRRWLHMAALLLLALLLALVPAAHAQEDEIASCDATLATLLIVAIQQYGYQPPVRLDFYDFDQYTPLVSQVAGVELTDYPESDMAEQVGSQAASAMNEAGENVAAGGLPGVGDALSDISDEVGAIASAGQEALEAGQAAISAGASAVEAESNPALLAYGGVAGEAQACTTLRTDLVDFMYAQLGGEPITTE